MKVNHVALLVKSIEDSIKKLPEELDFGPIETFADEGTKEIYIKSKTSSQSSLLLLQAIGEGPYMRALKKRGPGLHHICISTTSIKSATSKFVSSSLLIHPISIKTWDQGTLWFCRPGLPFLIEAIEDSNNDEINKPFVEKIHLKLSEEHANSFSKLSPDFLHQSAKNSISLRLKNGLFTIEIEDLVR